MDKPHPQQMLDSLPVIDAVKMDIRGWTRRETYNYRNRILALSYDLQMDVVTKVKGDKLYLWRIR